MIGKRFLSLFQSATIVFSLILILVLPTIQLYSIPVSGQPGVEESVTTIPRYGDFITTVSNGDASVIRGVFVPNVLALRVQQQPDNNDGYVSSVLGVATQFRLAAQSGVTGLLAHNYISGDLFFDLEIDQEVNIVYGDGSVQRYIISEIYEYQALQPNSTFSDFIDLETNQKLSSTQLFNQVYTGENHVTFQTCIAKDGNLTWGRLFVIATPIEETF